MRVFTAFIAVVLVSFAVVQAQAPPAAGERADRARPVFAGAPQYPLLPRALEIELAVSAAPKHLRDAAAVWILEPGGYTKVKPGTNAFACLVSRRGGDLFPVCWDAEGTRSLLPVDVDDAQMRLSGKSGAEIDEIVAQRFKAGQYHAPSRPGVAYMLSPLRYKIDEHGQVARTPSNPHLMFYGPNLTDADIGGARGSFVFLNRVGPDGMMIVPVGQTEREAIVAEARPLTEQLEQAIGYRQPPRPPDAPPPGFVPPPLSPTGVTLETTSLDAFVSAAQISERFRIAPSLVPLMTGFHRWNLQRAFLEAAAHTAQR